MARRLFTCFGRGSSSSSKHENTYESATADVTAEEQRRGGPVMVELFSSQGCATSPQAELLFSRIGRGDFNLEVPVILLAYHVDYWDYMGWKDPFGSSQWTVRQKAYVEALQLDTMFTPQVVVQGRAQCVGNDEDAVLSLIKSAPRVPGPTFQDEMEAPMWVDLTLECKFAYEDKDDEWFNISHPFHQLSSRELIAAFSGLDDGCTKLDFGVEGISSPKVPTSVSKSRGKHYRSREWGKEKHKATLSKRHPVKNLSSNGSLVNFGSDKARKDESCCRKIKEQTGLRSGSDGESSLIEIAGVNCLRTVSNSADLKNHADSVALRIVESHSNSTITSEDTAQQQQRKSLEVSSHVLGHTRGLLSALRVTLRKSCVTRQASRCEVKRGRQSEGRKSSSSKSSVGSSSNPGYEGKNLTARLSKERTPESRNVMRRSHTPNDKVNVANESFASLHINQETAEAEVRHHSKCPNVLVPHKVNAYTSTAAAKAKEVKGAAGDSRFARAGKENEAGRITVVQKSSSRLRYPTVATKAKERTITGQCSGSLGGSKVSAERRTAVSQKLSTLDKGAKGTVQAQNITKRRGLQKSVTEKLVASKERTGGRIERKGYANAAEKVYLR